MKRPSTNIRLAWACALIAGQRSPMWINETINRLLQRGDIGEYEANILREEFIQGNEDAPNNENTH